MNVEPGAKVAVVGASARAAAFSLLRAGHEVVAADLFADADLARVCEVTRLSPYPEGFGAWLANTPSDAWLYAGALENYPELIDRWASERPLWGCSGETLRRVRDPLELQRTLTSAGLNFPETKRPSAVREIDETWIGKTYRGSSGSGVGIHPGAPYLQRRVAGTPLSAVFRGSKLLGITRQLVGEPWSGATEFKYCGTIGPWSVPPEVERQVRRLGEIFARQFQLTELYGVDLLFDGTKVWILEVNPRYTAAVEVVERAYGISAFAPGQIPPAAPGASRGPREGERSCSAAVVGKAIFFAKTPLVVSATLSRRLLRQAGEFPWPDLADIPTPGTEIAVGQPVLTVLVTAEDCHAVLTQLRQRVREIESQLHGEPATCV